jgi:hypothetical protein
MAHAHAASNRPVLMRAGAFVAASTVALTLALFGLLAFVGGNPAGLPSRVPYYVLGAAVAFAAALVALDRRDRDGRNLLAVAVCVAGGTFVFLLLSVEGVTYAVVSPSEALGFQRVLYLLAAALFATGLEYWGLNHWTELVAAVRR